MGVFQLLSCAHVNCQWNFNDFESSSFTDVNISNGISVMLLIELQIFNLSRLQNVNIS